MWSFFAARKNSKLCNWSKNVLKPGGKTVRDVSNSVADVPKIIYLRGQMGPRNGLFAQIHHKSQIKSRLFRFTDIVDSGLLWPI